MIQIDIEMPKTCCDCPLHDGEYGWCNLNYDITMDCEERPKECPLHEVTDTDTISRQWLMECVNEGWIKFDTEKDKNIFIHLVRDIAPSVQPEQRLSCKNCIHLGYGYMMPCKNCKRNQMLPDWYEVETERKKND